MPRNENFYSIGPQNSILFPPLGLEYLAAQVEKYIEVKIVDDRIANHDSSHVKHEINSFNPDYVGIGCNYSAQNDLVLDIARVAKSAGVKTILGGWHPSLVPDELLSSEYVDLIVRGEGEAVFKDLVLGKDMKSIPGLSYKNGNDRVHNPDRELLDMASLKMPARHLRSHAARKAYNFFGFPADAIEVSRGCPYDCNFCCIHHFYKKKHRYRPIDHVIRELQSEKKKKKAFYIYVVDDNFVVSPEYVKELSAAILDNGIRKFFMTQARVDMIVRRPDVFEKMAEAGFLYLFLGIESFSDKTLKQLNKRTKFKQIKQALKILHDIGYIVQGNIILGASLDDTKEDLESTIEIANTMDIDLPTFSLLTPFPGTPLMEKVEAEDLLDRKSVV